MAEVVLVGRQSSHFTRVARIFALELGVPHAFRPVFDMTSLEAATYGENPALKVPILLDEQGALFGTENICRELVRRSGKSNVVMRGDSPDRLVANVEEMTLHVMSSVVLLITAKMPGGAERAPPKVSQSLENALHYLDQNVDALLEALPAGRSLSFVEAALFSVVTHLPFRLGIDVSSRTRLGDFARRFGERESARLTEYRFDVA